MIQQITSSGRANPGLPGPPGPAAPGDRRGGAVIFGVLRQEQQDQAETQQVNKDNDKDIDQACGFRFFLDD
jgi:hypothetical protein